MPKWKRRKPARRVTHMRVAFFPDSFGETNGVARTSRALVRAARCRGLPMLCVSAGDPEAVPQPETEETEHAWASWRGDAVPSTRGFADGGHLQLTRGLLSFPLDYGLRHDLLLWRHARRVLRAVRHFRADVVHVTGPSDVGRLGAYVAWRLELPLVASCHTNLDNYVTWRSRVIVRLLPRGPRSVVALWIERQSLNATLRFYQAAAVLLAPNPELVDLLHQSTGKATYLMRRGVDTELFSPLKRDGADGVFRLGYVGRLSAERNVRVLPAIEQRLIARGRTDFRFVIVGEGAERAWLSAHLKRADFAGLLRGAALARAYANMDLLIFPSETDTFGNVVLEALASGTPAVVAGRGGPKFIVQPGISGVVALDDAAFADAAEALMIDHARHRRMREQARRRALEASWDAVLDEVVEAYQAAMRSTGSPPMGAFLLPHATERSRIRSHLIERGLR
jgi:phosphatidylinositol alpha 1,6-mannosyltransferase